MINSIKYHKNKNHFRKYANMRYGRNRRLSVSGSVTNAGFPRFPGREIPGRVSGTPERTLLDYCDPLAL